MNINSIIRRCLHVLSSPIPGLSRRDVPERPERLKTGAITRQKARKLLLSGPKGIQEWNERRENGDKIPSLNGADLSQSKLNNANLTHVNLSLTNLADIDFRGANLFAANLKWANLEYANLSETDLRSASVDRTVFRRTEFTSAICGGTTFADVDLSYARGLETVVHEGPSTIGIDTIIKSGGKIPEAFLRGCGLSPWEVLWTSLYDSAMNPPLFVELQYQIFDAWTKGRGMINGCFISYSWSDAKFVDKLRNHLVDEGVNVWLDLNQA